MRKVKPKISAVIVTRNRKGELSELIDSLYKSSVKPSEIVVVDNASDIPVTSWLKKKYPKVRIVRSEENVGAAGGRNLGIANSSSEYVLFMDDDSVADKDMIKHLVKVFEKEENVGIVQPKVLDKDKKGVIQGAGHTINLLTGRIKAWGVMERDRGQYDGLCKVPMVGGICMIKREVFKRVGMFDEEYFIPYEDSDLSFRAYRAGFKVFCYGKAKSWHPSKKMKVHPALEWLGITIPERAFRVPRNKIIFMRKHSPFPYNLFFFFILLPAYAVAHSLIILSSRRLDVLGKYWLGFLSGVWYAMSFNRASFLYFLFLPLFIGFISYITLQPSLEFALWGDDWIALYMLKHSYGPGTVNDYTSIGGYFSPYAGPLHLVALIAYFWGSSHVAFYTSAFLLRVLAGVGIALVAYKLTSGNRLAALLAGLLFAVSPVGLETTNWGGWNMATYLVIFFFSFAFWFLITSYNSIKRYLLSLLFLVLSIMAFAQRIQTGILLFVVVDTFWLLKSFNFSKLRFYLFRQFLLGVIVFIIAFHFNTFGGPSDRIWFLNFVKEDLSAAKPYFWVSLFTALGNMLIPETTWSIPSIAKISEGIIGSTVMPRTRPLFLIFSLATLVLTALMRKRRKAFLSVSLLLGLVWTLYLKWALQDQPNSVLINTSTIFATFIGGYVTFWLLTYLLISFKKKKTTLLFALIVWPFVIASIAWARNHFNMPTTMRYAAVPGIFLPFLVAFIFASLNGAAKRFLVLSLALMLVVLHYSASQSYINQLWRVRNSQLQDNLWNDFLSSVSDYVPDEKYDVFYFEDDENNHGALYHTLIFGFPPRLGLTFNIEDSEREKFPILVDRFEDLLEVVNGGDLARRLGHAPEFITPDRIYAFRIEGNNLVDIKEEVLERLGDNGYPYKRRNVLRN